MSSLAMQARYTVHQLFHIRQFCTNYSVDRCYNTSTLENFYESSKSGFIIDLYQVVVIRAKSLCAAYLPINWLLQQVLNPFRVSSHHKLNFTNKKDALKPKQQLHSCYAANQSSRKQTRIRVEDLFGLPILPLLPGIGAIVVETLPLIWE